MSDTTTQDRDWVLRHLYERGVDVAVAESVEAAFAVAALVRPELEAPGDTGADAETMWYHWTYGSEDLALACLRVASDDQARRFLTMLASWQHCPRPSDHDRFEPPGEEA